MKKNGDKETDFLQDHYNKYQMKFDEFIKFLKKHHQHVMDFHKKATGNLFKPDAPGKHKLYAIFVDCINAAGGNNLSTTGESCKKFYEIINNLPNDELLDFNLFKEEFNSENKSPKGIFDKLVSDEYRNVKHKKAALFMRSIHIINNMIFNKYDGKDEDLYIPLDVVISDLLNQLLHIPFDEKLKIRPYNDFHLINKFSIEILDKEFMLIEDLWYWGFFNTRKIKSNYRKIEFNEDKFYSSRFVFPDEKDKTKFEEFREQFEKAIE